MRKTFHSKRRRVKNLVNRGCFFCLNPEEKVSSKNQPVLARFLSQRGKIVSRTRSGVCAKHQRILSRAIKTARINALLPFKDNVFS